MDEEKSTDSTHVKHKAIKSVKWTSLMNFVSRSSRPVTMLILARILAPTDFGIMGVAMIAIGLAQVIQDFGLEKTLIQRETDLKESANIVFWTNTFIGILIYLLIFIGAPYIADFFHEERVANVLKILCFQIVLLSLTKVHIALLQRDFQFKKLFVSQLTIAFIPPLISIPLAFMGWGVWALVWGSLAGYSTQLIAVWFLSPWRPQFSFNLPLARELFGFGGWVTLEMIMSWLIGYGDSVLVGHFLGIHELGVYRIGITFLTLVYGVFFTPLMSVSYSSFSRLQSNILELKTSLLKITKLIATVSIPLTFILMLTAKLSSIIVFGEKWRGIEIVIILIGLKDGISWLIGLNPELYRAVGRPDINVKLLFIAVLYYLPVYVFAAPKGLLIFCIARLGVALIALILHLFVANRILQLKYTYLLDCIKSPLISALPLIGILFAGQSFINKIPWYAALVVLVPILTLSILSYLLTLWVLDRKFIIQSFKLVKKAVK